MAGDRQIVDYHLEWDPITVACGYARAGLHVISLIGKAPWQKDWPDLGTTNISEVVQAFDEAIHRAGSSEKVWVGWTLGVDGYMAPDIDTPAAIGPEFQAVLDAGGYARNQTSRPEKFHAIYRTPLGVVPGNSTGKFPEQGWGEMRSYHGQIAIAGPDRPGLDVAQLQHAVQFPRPDWLTPWEDSGSSASSAEVEAFLAANTGTLYLPRLRWVVGLAADEGWKPARHDRVMAALGWAMRDARLGLFPARDAAEQLRRVFLAAIGDEAAARTRERNETPEREFDRLLARGVGLAIDMTDQELEERRWEVIDSGAYSLLFNLADLNVSTALPPTVDCQPEAEEDEDEPFLIDWSEAHDPDDDIVDGVALPGRWTQFVAGAKVGKSSLTMFMCIELSEGRDPFDGSPIDPVMVLYCDGEMGRPDLEKLIKDCGHDPVKLTRLHCSERRLRLDTDNGASRLLRWVDRLRAKVVVLDGLNGFIDPEATENDDKTWKPFYERSIRPLKDRGDAVLSNDNMGKDASRGSRGSSVKNDKADAVVSVKRIDKGGVRLKTTHARAGAFIDELALDSEGFDRSRPIRYWRAASAGYPNGTAEATRTLDALKVPLDWGRRRIRTLLADKVREAEAKGLDAEPYRIGNEPLAGAIRYRRQHVIRPGQTP